MVKMRKEMVTREFIEAECLKAARREQGCSDLVKVRIGRTKPRGSGPNWEVLGFSPALPELAQIYAFDAIDRLRQTYPLRLTSGRLDPLWSWALKRKAASLPH